MDDRYLDEQFAAISENVAFKQKVITEVLGSQTDVLARQSLILAGQQNEILVAIYRELVAMRRCAADQQSF